MALVGFVPANIVLVNGSKLDLAGSMEVREYCDRFAWGYECPACSQLALAILLRYLPPAESVVYAPILGYHWVSELPMRDFSIVVDLRNLVFYYGNLDRTAQPKSDGKL